MTNCQGKILAIDDEPIILDLIKLNLENEGYSVDICNSAEDAFQLNLSIYDFIIADVIMGKIKGAEFANKLKQNPETSHIPIILCLEKGSEDDIVTGLRAGIDDYIMKPISMRELTARIKSILRRHKINSSHNKKN